MRGWRSGVGRPVPPEAFLVMWMAVSTPCPYLVILPRMPASSSPVLMGPLSYWKRPTLVTSLCLNHPFRDPRLTHSACAENMPSLYEFGGDIAPSNTQPQI